MDTLNNVLSEVIVKLILLLLPFLMGAAFEVARRVIGVQKLSKLKHVLDIKNSLAADAVLFAQQAFKDLDGEQKYQKALQALSQRLEMYGINYDPGELGILIESALKEIKKDFSADWAKIPDNLTQSSTGIALQSATINVQTSQNADEVAQKVIDNIQTKLSTVAVDG